MDGRKRPRGVYVSARQKKKLLQMMTQHPELISCRVTQGFNYKDSQKLWNKISNECNSIPGARKTWRQWRKTWQDIRSKAKIRQERFGDVPMSFVMLSQAEQETLGIKPMATTDPMNYHDMEEVEALDEDLIKEAVNSNNETESEANYSEPESPPEEKVFTRSRNKISTKLENKSKINSNHSNDCVFNCDVLAVQERRKIQIKEDYLNFKKDYLKQKLKLIKEQTEALKSIAKELSK